MVVGYQCDGYPIYGLCANVAGETLTSCYTLNSGEEGDFETDYTWDWAGYESGTCHLDQCNGYTFSDGSYGYVTSEDYPYVAPCRNNRRCKDACLLDVSGL